MNANMNFAGAQATSDWQASDEVVILLGLHQGEDFLSEQLESLRRQTHEAWSLLVSDDGSTDRSRDIVEDFAHRNGERRISLCDGPCRGWTANFLSLLRSAGPDASFVAFCDQDDVWSPDKLARALSKLREVSEGQPALYCARTLITDRSLRQRRPSPCFRRPPSFENALVQSIAGGNTMVLNRAAARALQRASAQASHVVSHDWWAYQVITGIGGTVIYDHHPTVLYRQHGRNLVGANDTWLASFRRLDQGLRGRFRSWNSANLTAIQAIEDQLTPRSRQILREFCRARNAGLIGRLSCLWKSGVHRQTRRGTLSLWLATILGKI